MGLRRSKEGWVRDRGRGRMREDVGERDSNLRVGCGGRYSHLFASQFFPHSVRQ